MKFDEYLNQHVVTKDNKEGVIVSFDSEHVVIDFNGIRKTFVTELVFKQKYFYFINDKYNKIIDEYLNNLEKQKELDEFNKNKVNEIAINRNKRIRDMFLKISEKNKKMLMLFGRDFVYPPYAKFIKKYKRFLKII